MSTIPANLLKRFLAIAVLCVIPMAHAATGSVGNILIESNGWSMTFTPTNMVTNGVYTNMGYVGFTPLSLPIPGVITNIATLNKMGITLHVLSPGFNADGTTNQTYRRIYGTVPIRKAYPGTNSLGVFVNDEVPTDTTNVTVKVALSDYIHSNDIVTADFLDGVYTAGGTKSVAATGLSVTVNSTMPYPHVIADYAELDGTVETNSTMKVGVCAFDRYGMRGVKFIISDAHGHSVSNMVTDMAVDWTVLDMIPVPEFAWWVNLANFTAGDPLSIDWIAYPNIGNAAACWDTTLKQYAMPTLFPCTLTNVCDPNNTYSRVCFVVDPTIGTNATGVCATNGDPTSISSAHYFATISAGLAAAKATNAIVTTHADTGGVHGYLRGTFDFAPTQIGYGARPLGFPTLQPYPGMSGGISNNVANSKQPVRCKFLNLTINPSVGNYFWTSNNFYNELQFQGCTLSTSASIFGTTTGNVVSNELTGAAITSSQCCPIKLFDCTVIDVGTGLRHQANTKCAFWVRGCDLTMFNRDCVIYGLWVGNDHPTTNGNAMTMEFDFTPVSANTPPVGDGIAFLLNSRMAGMSGANAHFSGFENQNCLVGCAAVNFIYECVTNGGNAFCQWSSSDSVATNINCCLVNCVFAGTKFAGLNYNWNTGSVLRRDRLMCCIINCIIYSPHTKADFLGTGQSDNNGIRVGDWPEVFGCGNYSVAFLKINCGGNTQYVPEWLGNYCFGTNTPPGANTLTNDVSWIKFVNPQAYVDGGSNPAAGGGDYRLLSDSPLNRMKARPIFPIGFDGKPITSLSSTGPWGFNYKMTGGMF